MGRLFIAVVPSQLKENPELRVLLSKLKRTLKDRGQEVRWTAPDLWHVTVAFLGDGLGSSGAGRLKEVLLSFLQNRKELYAGLVLRLQGLGAFPSNDEARVLWLGVQQNQAFLDFQSELQVSLRAAGFNLSERESRPHLTLGRFRNLMNVNDLVKLGGRKHFGDYPVSELILFESVLQGNILKYMPQFRLGL